MKKTIVAKCKKCGRKAHIQEKQEGDFKKTITYKCGYCGFVFENIGVDEVFESNMGEMKISQKNSRNALFGTFDIVLGIIVSFFSLSWGLTLIFVGIIFFLFAMASERKRQKFI